jgi:hypothetical protein
MWINKAITLKELYFEVFKYFRGIFGEWLDAIDPNKEAKPALKNLINFPYVAGELTRD